MHVISAFCVISIGGNVIFTQLNSCKILIPHASKPPYCVTLKREKSFIIGNVN